MQKTVRINLLARNSAAKHFQKIKHRDTKQEWKLWHQTTNRSKAIEGQYVREERLHRRQDWIAGPLAPNRNAGPDKGTYGTTSSEYHQTADVPKSVRAAPKKEGYAAISEKEEEEGFKGDTIVGNVVADDTVVIVAGPARLRGLIGTVSDVDNAKETVKLMNINTADVRIPSYAQPPANPNDPNPAKYSSVDLPIPMSHVRLVRPIEDDDGIERDIVIRHVHAGPPYLQRPVGSHLPSHTRYITGELDRHGRPIEIPWGEDHQSSNDIFHEGDTTRGAVQASSWTPTLGYSPLGYTASIPDSVATNDEPYSRAQELFTIDVNGPDGLNNTQRVGLTGFIDRAKLEARQQRIADGIMGELRAKSKELNIRHDDAAWVKRKMIEDARAIWYKERKLVSPASQAAERAVQERAAARQAKIEAEKEALAELERVVNNSRAVGFEREKKWIGLKVKRVDKPVVQRVKFLPDKKLAKKLRREQEKREGMLNVVGEVE